MFTKQRKSPSFVFCPILFSFLIFQVFDFPCSSLLYSGGHPLLPVGPLRSGQFGRLEVGLGRRSWHALAGLLRCGSYTAPPFKHKKQKTTSHRTEGWGSGNEESSRSESGEDEAKSKGTFLDVPSMIALCRGVAFAYSAARSCAT